MKFLGTELCNPGCVNALKDQTAIFSSMALGIVVQHCDADKYLSYWIDCHESHDDFGDPLAVLLAPPTGQK